MARMNRVTGLALGLVLLAASIASEVHADEALTFADDGWYQWHVATTGEFSEETFYVRIKAGEPQEIEILGHWCRGWKHSKERYPDAVDLGRIDTDQSIDWFEQYIGSRTDLSSDALAAISMHDSDRALTVMIAVVESDAHMDVREEAVFWMAQSQSEAAFAYLDRLLNKE